MFASIQDLEFVPEQSRDVPERVLGLNSHISFLKASFPVLVPN